MIRGWKWTYETGTWGQNMFREFLGEKGWRICVGAILAVALAGVLYLFFAAAGSGEDLQSFSSQINYRADKSSIFAKK